MGKSNSTQAHSNYLICMRFIRVSTVAHFDIRLHQRFERIVMSFLNPEIALIDFHILLHALLNFVRHWPRRAALPARTALATPDHGLIFPFTGRPLDQVKTTLPTLFNINQLLSKNIRGKRKLLAITGEISYRETLQINRQIMTVSISIVIHHLRAQHTNAFQSSFVPTSVYVWNRSRSTYNITRV